MAVKLASLKANLRREEQGDWVEYPEWPGVAFNVSSLHKPAYRVALDLLLQKLARQYGHKPIPPDVRAQAVGRLYCEHILHGWRGLDNDDGTKVEYSPDVAIEVLSDPAYRNVVTAVEWCAARISELDVEFTKDVEKNSDRPSVEVSATKAGRKTG